MTLGLRFTSIRLKVMLVIGVVSSLSLLVAGGALLYQDWMRYREVQGKQLSTLSDIISRASAPALAFNDKKTATENLALLAGAPDVLVAGLYTARGEMFARYLASGHEQAILPRLPEGDGLHVSADSLIMYQRIIDQDDILGTLYIEMRNDQTQRLLYSLGGMGIVLLVAMLAGLLLSTKLQQSITGPILSVADVARRVVEQRDFSLRAPLTSKDETGSLVLSFNAMLDELERRAAELAAVNQSLEREIASRQSTQDALQLNERRSQALVSAMAAVTWATDRQGSWIGDYPVWTAYTGMRAADCRGAGWRLAFAEEDRARVGQVWEAGVEDGSPFEVEARLWHQDSHAYRFVSLRAVPCHDAQGNLEEWIGAVSDIHDKRLAEDEVRMLAAELEQRVAQRTRQLEEANRELESFSYSVSHDLRAPIRAVSGFSSILSKEHGAQLNAEAQRLLGIIQSEAARMGVLIDDLLAFSRLGRKALQPITLDMGEMAQSVLDRLMLQHSDSSPDVRIGTLPEAIGDHSLLVQVWSNLLANALKFSARVAHPVVEVGAISEEKEHVFFVRDNGAGFDPRHKGKLFGVFQRLHDASEFSGTGVGLALVQRIVNRHGGRVWAEGAIDKGATFYFTLPREAEHGSA